VVTGFGLVAVLGAVALFFILRRLQVGDRFGLAPAMLAMAVVVVLPVPLSALLRPTMSGKHAA